MLNNLNGIKFDDKGIVIMVSNTDLGVHMLGKKDGTVGKVMFLDILEAIKKYQGQNASVKFL